MGGRLVAFGARDQRPAAAPVMSVMPRRRQSATKNAIGRDGRSEDESAKPLSI